MATGKYESALRKTCRYCLTNTNEHIVQYFFADKQDKYEKILKDTFNIQICISENKILCLECEEDIKNAAEVKKRVLSAQNILLKHNENISLLDSEALKEEVASDYEEWGIESETGRGEVGFSETASKNEVKKAYVKIDLMKNEIQSKPKRKAVTKMLKIQNKNIKTADNKGKHASFTINKSLMEKRENTLFLLQNSNMCLFTPKKNKYSCFVCKETYLDMQKLRAHSLTHETDKVKRSIIHSRGKNLKTVEISNLSCEKCSHPCTDLDELRVHLKNNHDQPFQGTEHLLLPFKIEERLACVICQKEFVSFKTLFTHMNCHSSNHVCEICGVSYNNMISLKQHIKVVHRESKCSICLAILPTVAAKTKHLRIVHNKVNRKRYCTQCNMVFRYTYKLNEHMVEKHGAKKTVSVCEQCNKEFVSDIGLRTHFKSVHLGERKHGCSLCSMSFFTTFDKRRHEKTHGNEKPFSCGFCDIKFRSKDSLQRHLRRKHEGSKRD